jgi:hypothetical protein
MPTGTRSAALAGLLALAASGCGTSAPSPPGSSSPAASGARARAQPAGFDWLAPRPAPPGWLGAALPGGARLAYPPTWRALAGDPGTVSAALRDARGAYLGYLNLTPRQGGETPAGWSSFRPRHNAREGDRNVTVEAAAAGLRFRDGAGACVQDAYTGTTGVRYVEISCLIIGTRAASVVVGAAPSARWREQAPVIERAVAATIA